MLKNMFIFFSVLMTLEISFANPVSHVMSQEELKQFEKETSQYNFKVEHAFKFMGRYEELKSSYNPKKIYCGHYIDMYNPLLQFIDMVPTIRVIENEMNGKNKFSRTRLVLDDANDTAGYRFGYFPTSDIVSKATISTINLFRVIWMSRGFDAQEMKFTYNYNEVGWGGAVIKRSIQLENDNKLTLIDDLTTCDLKKMPLTFTEAATVLSNKSRYLIRDEIAIGMINFFNYIDFIKYELTPQQANDIEGARKILEKITP